MLLWKLVVFWLSRQKSIISNYTFKPISFKISSWSLICRDVSKEVLIYLCSKQALKDLKNFISSMEEKYHLQSRKWIVFGGSYPGIVLLLVYNIFANFLLMRKIKWTFPIRFTFKYFFFQVYLLCGQGWNIPIWLIWQCQHCSTTNCHVGLFRLLLLFLISF